MEKTVEWGAFGPADILLPRGCSMQKWSAVACDQYTSQPEYWEEAERFVGEAPSTLRLMFPEVYLGKDDAPVRIRKIHAAMRAYLDAGRFSKLKNSFVYLERTLSNGAVRRGLVGAVDLEQYDYSTDSASLIRPTEGTVVARIKPRMEIREGAPIELSHVMLLIDDPDDTVIEPLARRKGALAPLYNFELMQGGGHLSGWWLPADQAGTVQKALAALASPEVFAQKYGMPEKPVLVYASGDGNHSLATARACYEKLKREIGDVARNHPARYAMVELVNIHDPSLVFEPIHRVVTGVDAQKLCADFVEAMVNGGTSFDSGDTARRVRMLYDCGGVELYLGGNALPVGVVQDFLDSWMKENGGKIDYVHGGHVAERLGVQPSAAAFLLPTIGKSALFGAVARDGALPRKTFSMGEANEKRFYLECRRITEER
ncbi:MAG: DUF1015 domain-containing protein [Ethanoligenens sp.]